MHTRIHLYSYILFFISTHLALVYSAGAVHTPSLCRDAVYKYIHAYLRTYIHIFKGVFTCVFTYIHTHT